MNDMLRDKGGMFGTSKWDTHAAGLQGRLDNISAMISLGQKLGCDMSAEIDIFANLSMPRDAKVKVRVDFFLQTSDGISIGHVEGTLEFPFAPEVGDTINLMFFRGRN
ncbi:hypothetical protein GDR29_05750 [Xanthomonas oryzae pv. oryzae]|nr:hypothetical protein GDR29_05750 [Xanthomonas oryzae pv. oryzae]